MSEQIDFSPHRKTDPGWGGPALRRCPGCRPVNGDFHELDYFIAGPDGTYSVLCRRCHLKSSKVKATIGMDEAATSIVTAMAAATVQAKRDGLKIDPFKVTCDAAGGAERLYNGIGRVAAHTLRNGIKKGATNADKDRAVKVSKIFLDHATHVEKSKPTMFDLSGFTEEETAELIMAMIQDNRALRARIIGDPGIRKLLLNELDVEVIETRVEDRRW